MKYLLILLLCPFTLSAQAKHDTAATQLPKKLIRISTPRLTIENSDSSVLLLKMEFNGSIPRSKLAGIRADKIESVSLVYSRYKLSETFDQLTLNARRMDQLFALLPGLQENKAVQWYWVEQTGCDDPESCHDFFHGFVIRLKTEAAVMTTAMESELLDYYVSVYSGEEPKPGKLDSMVKTGKTHFIKICDTLEVRKLNKQNRLAKIRGWDREDNDKLIRFLKEEFKETDEVSLKLSINEKGRFTGLEYDGELAKQRQIVKLLNSEFSAVPARYKGKKIASEVYINICKSCKGKKVLMTHRPLLPGTDSFDLAGFLYTVNKEVHCDYIDTSKGMSLSLKTPDVVYKVFNRNKQWRNYLVATDVTGSMYPYLAQFLAWHKLHLGLSSAEHKFVFFNDGDNMPDWIKRSGCVGGIYPVSTSEYGELNMTMQLSMRKGGGGDGPENNIEAVIKGLKQYPACESVVMIADNWATPRDLDLLNKVKVPIRLVLCGTHWGGFNTAYLDMIRKNGGSIHTMEEDLYDLGKLTEGKTIKLEGVDYTIRDGVFRRAD